jgi:transposase
MKRSTLENSVEKTKSDFAELESKLNRHKLKTEESIDAACQSILTKRKTSDFFEFHISNDPVITYKNTKRGRPSQNQKNEQVAVVTDHFKVELQFKQYPFDKALDRCGYYPLITNKPKEEFSIHDAMMAHKNQYKIEHTNRRAKSGFSLEPIYLQTPERIEAFLMLFKTALQIIVLIERTARKNIEKRNRGLDNFMPNRKDVRNPRTEYLLSEFQYVVKGNLPLPDGNTYGFVSRLNQLQEDILNLLEVPTHCYSYSYVVNTS